jgi:hypothetical protein
MREAYRINTVILLGKGRTGADVADALLIDPETVHTSLVNELLLEIPATGQVVID